MPTLETERLVLRPFAEADLDQYAAIVADPQVQRDVGGVQDRAGAWHAMALFLGHEVLRGWSQCAVVERTTGRVIGRAGLWRPEGWPGLEVGWVLARAAWGRGYATEAGAAWRDWAFRVLGAGELLSVIHPDNAASIRVAERIGHRYLRDDRVRGTRCRIYGQQRHG